MDKFLKLQVEHEVRLASLLREHVGVIKHGFEEERLLIEADFFEVIQDAMESARVLQVEYLKDRLHKADGMANEINILNREVWKLRERLQSRVSLCKCLNANPETGCLSCNLDHVALGTHKQEKS